MARTAIAKGHCRYCNAQYSRAAMVKHFSKCNKYGEKIANDASNKEIFEMLITGGHAGKYWLVVEMQANEWLSSLDGFLREIWVECCCHLSEFEIAGRRYVSDDKRGFFYGDNDMYISLDSVLAPGMTFIYRYDFGSTTTLKIEVKSKRLGYIGNSEHVPGRLCYGDAVRLLSRNDVTEVCDVCGEARPAWIDIEAFYTGEPVFWCKACFEKSVVEEEPDFDPESEELEDYLPDSFREFCNSPRMGICGYSGSQYYGDDLIIE